MPMFPEMVDSTIRTINREDAKMVKEIQIMNLETESRKGLTLCKRGGTIPPAR